MTLDSLFDTRRIKLNKQLMDKYGYTRKDEPEKEKEDSKKPEEKK